MMRTAGALLWAAALLGQDFGTIQEAIDRAAENDIVRVPHGVYEERIDFQGKSLQLIGWDFERDTPGHPFDHIIVCPPEDGIFQTVVTIRGPEPSRQSRAVLEGFSIFNGSAPEGGGIAITGNVLAEICRCYISCNHARNPEGPGRGGGIFVDSAASCAILSSFVVDNGADSGAAIYIASSPGLEQRSICLVNTTVSRNSAPVGEAVFIGRIGLAAAGTPCLFNNILWANEQGLDIASEAQVQSHYSILGEAHNVECVVDTCVPGPPGFADYAHGNFRLTSQSPARDAGLAAPPCVVRPFGRPTDHYVDIDGELRGLPHIGADDPPTDPVDSFVRGDVIWDEPGGPNDGLGIEDAMCILGWYFENDPEYTWYVDLCEDAADVNNDGQIDIGDAIYLLSYLAESGQPPPDPFPPPDGPDPPPADLLECEWWGPYYKAPGGGTCPCVP